MSRPQLHLSHIFLLTLFSIFFFLVQVSREMGKSRAILNQVMLCSRKVGKSQEM